MTEIMTEDVDVLIVGAGINGAGLFRDLCAQGVTCLIVDKADFGSGTSAAPSRLIHGGLKYLETGEFRLVAESTYERNLLLANAAHLVKPLPTLIPIYSWTKGVWAALRTLLGSKTAPRARGAVLVKIGLGLYDRFGARARIMPRHRMFSRQHALREVPALNPRIVAAGMYHDASISAPERLVLELLQDGVLDCPSSEALNWTSLEGLIEGAVRLKLPAGPERHIRPKVLVNAAGPWIDGVNATLGIEQKLIGGTKGSHILLDHPELLAQLNGRMLYFESDDGRILLVFPYLGKAMVGSTDIPSDDPDRARCSDEETDYFLSSLSALLPGLAFDKSQIVFSYAGIRPLPNSEGVAPGLISRDHSAPVLAAEPDRPFPVMSLVGGKWTTFRAFSEEVADTVLSTLKRSRRCSTVDLPIGGGRSFPTTAARRREWCDDVAAVSGASSSRVDSLLERYGTAARKIALKEGAAPEMILNAPYSRAEITWIAQSESVEHLQDVLLRRTQLAITGQLSSSMVDTIGATIASALGWSETRLQEELLDTYTTLRDKHGLKLTGGNNGNK